MRSIIIFWALILPIVLFSQGNFTTEAYSQFLIDNADLSAEQIINRYQPDSPFYNARTDGFSVSEYSFLDSIQLKYELTDDELATLRTNHFFVSERLSYDCFGRALHDIYQKDLPVFVTSDAILYALHFSYDRILLDIEKTLLEQKLRDALDALYAAYPGLQQKYADQPILGDALKDVDLYITMAKSLQDERLAAAQFADREKLNDLWNAVEAEQFVSMPLFSERSRKLDFSQFTVRGHYTKEFWDLNGKRTLGNYFKAMMWLGRMDFYLTPPPDAENPWQPEEIKRMLAGALLMNELFEMSGAADDIKTIDDIITFMVGASDNLTPAQLSDIVNRLQVTPDQAFDDAVYAQLQQELLADVNYGQRIMSAFFLVDPYAAEPDPLPVSYRMLGQRFIIDSYVLANVVYDRIIFQNTKIWRPMPDPLDAMFVLGADNALPLLEEDLEEYKYGSQLEALRYLTDAYDDDFWGESLYNVWLQGIRSLFSQEERAHQPYFMKTVAWQQQKLNTALSSWAQLRHDNLLYAKQSYTGGTSCSYPHSFVEPYPELYAQIALFAEKAEAILIPLIGSDDWESTLLKSYFPKLKAVTKKLQNIAEKELRGEVFNDEEITWLQRMLFIDGMSGAPPFSGWYADLFYRLEQTPDSQYEGHDYLVADVHTQPTDRGGAPVGRVLHVGVGEVNLGVFLADAPSDGYAPMAYVGAVMSYYEEITSNFKRLTDENWAEMVKQKNLPQRPDWVNVYLLDEKGSAQAEGRVLPGVTYQATGAGSGSQQPQDFILLHNYPNPFNPTTTIEWTIGTDVDVTLKIYDVRGREIAILVDRHQLSGSHTIKWDALNQPAGVYFARLEAGEQMRTIKLLLVK
jgi:hypothetical protein